MPCLRVVHLPTGDAGRVALENAVSVAGTLLLTEATMTEVKDQQTERAPAEVH